MLHTEIVTLAENDVYTIFLRQLTDLYSFFFVV